MKAKIKSRVDARITKGLPDNERDMILGAYGNAGLLRQHLIKVLTREIECATLSVESEDFFEKPNLQERIVRNSAYRAALRDVCKLLDGKVIVED
jgi:hypothetical protein